MYRRCTKDLFGYCATKPNIEGAAKETVLQYRSGEEYGRVYNYGSCRRDPTRCRRYITWTEECERLLPGSTAKTETPAAPGTAPAT